MPYLFNCSKETDSTRGSKAKTPLLIKKRSLAENDKTPNVNDLLDENPDSETSWTSTNEINGNENQSNPVKSSQSIQVDLNFNLLPTRQRSQSLKDFDPSTQEELKSNSLIGKNQDAYKQITSVFRSAGPRKIRVSSNFSSTKQLGVKKIN